MRARDDLHVCVVSATSCATSSQAEAVARGQRPCARFDAERWLSFVHPRRASPAAAANNKNEYTLLVLRPIIRR